VNDKESSASRDADRTGAGAVHGDSSPKGIKEFVWFLGLLGLGFSLYATSVGFHNTLFDSYGARQTQTAISADSMLHGGSFLRYETPVLGPPWALPFEFPLYQGIVAELAKTFHTRLEETGRFVSIVFYYLCFLPLASILSRIGFRGPLLVPPLVLFAMSPIYIYFSRVFMIESTALFLSLLYADQMFKLVLDRRKWQYRHMAAGAAFGSLAGLVKVTTFAPFLALGIWLAVWGLQKDRESRELKAKTTGAVTALCLVLPVAATWCWTRFADSVKAQNPLGAYLTSKALVAWNFGTLAQRLRPRPYGHFLLAANNHIGYLGAAAVVVLVYIWLCRGWNWIAVACIALYSGTILVFFNLHFVHEYYPYSSAIFLVVAIGVLIVSILRLRGPRAWIGVALLVLEMAACGARYFTHFYPIQSRNSPGLPEAAALIDRTTGPDSVIVILGMTWSSSFPYQSHRRAIMEPIVTSSMKPNQVVGIEPFEHAISNAGPKNIEALMACGEGRYDPRLPILLRDISMPGEANMRADGCDIYEHSVSLVIPEKP
jgi:hypothetical protein